MERQDNHATPDMIRQLLRAKLAREDVAGVIRHLLARCPECLLATGHAAWADRLPPLVRLERRHPGWLRDRPSGKGWRGRRRLE